MAIKRRLVSQTNFGQSYSEKYFKNKVISGTIYLQEKIVHPKTRREEYFTQIHELICWKYSGKQPNTAALLLQACHWQDRHTLLMFEATAVNYMNWPSNPSKWENCPTTFLFQAEDIHHLLILHLKSHPSPIGSRFEAPIHSRFSKKSIVGSDSEPFLYSLQNLSSNRPFAVLVKLELIKHIAG